MDKDVDLSIRLAGLTFKSPIVVASSECAANLSLIQNLADKNIRIQSHRNALISRKSIKIPACCAVNAKQPAFIMYLKSIKTKNM